MVENRKKYWVSPNGTLWVVTHDKQQLSRHITKQEAVTAGRKVARANAPSQLLIMRGDGTIEDENTYLLDPYPPRG
ncbi:DUF2188 domain-containing protein [Actinomycetospora sp. C-140]